MHRFQWNALRVGAPVVVHDDLDPGLALHDGMVRLVQTRSHGANEIGIRLDDRPAEMLRPRRQAVHLVPIDEGDSCWRCDVVTAKTTTTGSARKE